MSRKPSFHGLFSRSSLLAGAVVLAVSACASRPSSLNDSASSGATRTIANAPSDAMARTYGKPTPAQLDALTPMQRRVTQGAATEPPFRNAFWDHHEAGIYVDVATGEPLFSSLDKFESGTGWPSFIRPIEAGRVDAHVDTTIGMVRTEVLSHGGASHLGHVFDDGPEPTGQRYCINSAALRFIPVSELEAAGYGAYKARFTGSVAGGLPAATSNSCTIPPPGVRPGCTATVEIATVGGPCAWATKELTRAIAGVVEVSTAIDATDGTEVLDVTFESASTSFAVFSREWLAVAQKVGVRPTLFPATDSQREAARAMEGVDLRSQAKVIKEGASTCRTRVQ